ncbi:hypothetical protein C0989_001605 [Termitomyces sp. Mn162]|nr:hypothetical protein C0989_001605 [Termitomyces sp. Mn162]
MAGTSSSTSSYYTAKTSFSTSSSSSLYFTPNSSFEEEKQGEYLLKDGSTRHILSPESPENIARKEQIKIDQTAERELEALLREKDLAYNPEDQGFDMDVDSEPEPWSDDDTITDAWRDKYTTEAADTVTSKKSRLARSDTDPVKVYRTASIPLDTENQRHPQPLRRQQMKRWKI